MGLSIGGALKPTFFQICSDLLEINWLKDKGETGGRSTGKHKNGGVAEDRAGGCPRAGGTVQRHNLCVRTLNLRLAVQVLIKLEMLRPAKQICLCHK